MGLCDMEKNFVMSWINKACALHVLAAALFYVVPAAGKTEQSPAKFEYDPEVYTERGQPNGCGASFTVVWEDTEKRTVGATGSLNFFFFPDTKQFTTVLKVTAVVSTKQAALAYAWLETSGHGKTTDFSPSYKQDPLSFLATLQGTKGVGMPFAMVRDGFVLGLTIANETIDQAVRAPPAPPQVISQVEACLRSLNERIQSAS